MRTLPSVRPLALAVALAASTPLTSLLSQPAPQPTPEQQLVEVIRGFLAKDFVTDWQGLEKLPNITWAALPPTALQNCLPDGGCYARQGRLTVAGRNLAVIASGARSIVQYVYLRNGSAPFGEAKLVEAMMKAELAPELVRCPIPGKAGGTHWYRLRSALTNSGILSIQTSCNGRPCEGFVLSLGEEPPALQPAQLSL